MCPSTRLLEGKGKKKLSFKYLEMWNRAFLIIPFTVLSERKKKFLFKYLEMLNIAILM